VIVDIERSDTAQYRKRELLQKWRSFQYGYDVGCPLLQSLAQVRKYQASQTSEGNQVLHVRSNPTPLLGLLSVVLSRI
jgi:hypothetical protein